MSYSSRRHRVIRWYSQIRCSLGSNDRPGGRYLNMSRRMPHNGEHFGKYMFSRLSGDPQPIVINGALNPLVCYSGMKITGATLLRVSLAIKYAVTRVKNGSLDL